jgi:hypothetical protein
MLTSGKQPDILTLAEYLTAIANAFLENRIDAKEFAEATPEQRLEWASRLVQEEKDAIAAGLARHEEKKDETN